MWIETKRNKIEFIRNRLNEVIKNGDFYDIAIKNIDLYSKDKDSKLKVTKDGFFVEKGSEEKFNLSFDPSYEEVQHIYINIECFNGRIKEYFELHFIDDKTISIKKREDFMTLDTNNNFTSFGSKKENLIYIDNKLGYKLIEEEESFISDATKNYRNSKEIYVLENTAVSKNEFKSNIEFFHQPKFSYYITNSFDEPDYDTRNNDLINVSVYGMHSTTEEVFEEVKADCLKTKRVLNRINEEV